MDRLLEEFVRAQAEKNGYRLGKTFSPEAPLDGPGGLRAIWKSTNYASVKKDVRHRIQGLSSIHRVRGDELNGWVEAYVAYWKAIGEIVAVHNGSPQASRMKIYDQWKEVTSLLIRGYTNYGFEAWTIPCLYVAGKHLRLAAVRSDEERNANPNGGASGDNDQSFADDFDPEMERHSQLRDCEQHLKRMFTLCLSDRAPLEESRKWGIYYIINLLFKTYFKLNSASLSRTILKALSAYQGDMPPLDVFPASQRVTFKYYEGVLSFLEENYVEAEKHLTEAWNLCHRDATRNKERILLYLIPCHLLINHTLPSKELLAPFPRLQRLFYPLSKCIRQGNLQALGKALEDGEDDFVKYRIYLTLERGRDITLRNLLRKVFVAGGFDEPKEPGATPMRRTRVPVAEFQAAVSYSSGQNMDVDEVECLLANMVSKNLMKGYISRERGTVVLSKTGAFPGTGV